MGPLRTKRLGARDREINRQTERQICKHTDRQEEIRKRQTNIHIIGHRQLTFVRERVRQSEEY